MADRPDLIDPLPEDDTVPGDDVPDVPDVPDVNDPLAPEDPDGVNKPL